MRIAAETDQSPTLLAALNAAEVEARKLDMQEIIWLRQQSHVSWLKWGDTPTKYFFNQLKAKQSCESIHKLQREDGAITENEEEIL